jgi:NADH-quinone oxidoreductase subunit M
MDALLHLVIFLPLAGALLVWLAPSRPGTSRTLAALVSGVVLLLSLVLFANFNRTAGGFQFDTNLRWIPAIGANYHVAVDGISLPLVILNALLTFLAVLVSWNLTLRPKEYFALVLVLETAVAGVFTSLDFFLFFLFWELELAPMFLLIGIWGGPNRDYAAMKFLIYTVLGGAFLLLGILVLYFGAGISTFDMLALSGASNTLPFYLQVATFLLLAVAFAVKIPIFPFHTWLPDAHVEAPTAISVLLAGVLLKMGGYGLLRVCVSVLPGAAVYLAGVLAALAVINIIYGALVALAQRDLKKIIANSSVSHMGFVVLGISALTQTGFEGAVLQMFTHGTITGLLFMMVGLVYDRTHTRDVWAMGGLAQQMPKIATVFVVAGLASLGLPGLSGFVAEFLVFLGSFSGQTGALLTVLGTFGIVLSAGYILWLLERVFYGPMSDQWRSLTDATRLEMVTVGTLVALIVLVGVYPNILLDVIANSVAPIYDRVAPLVAQMAT